MKLYVFPIAPNPTRVRLYLAEKAAAGAPLPVEEVTVDLLAGEQRSEAHRARNPFGTLPVLELEDGRCLTESLAIVEYLEELHPEPSLLGGDPGPDRALARALARARVRELERIAELGVLWPVGHLLHATSSPLGLPASPEVADFFRARLPRALRVLENTLADGRPFLAGRDVTLADCTLQAALQFARFGAGRGVRFVGEAEGGPAGAGDGAADDVSVLGRGFPHLAAWSARYRERPAAKAVLMA